MQRRSRTDPSFDGKRNIAELPSSMALSSPPLPFPRSSALSWNCQRRRTGKSTTRPCPSSDGVPSVELARAARLTGAPDGINPWADFHIPTDRQQGSVFVSPNVPTSKTERRVLGGQANHFDLAVHDRELGVLIVMFGRQLPPHPSSTTIDPCGKSPIWLAAGDTQGVNARLLAPFASKY